VVVKLKVCHIITGLNDGGAEGVLYRLCQNADDFETHVISLMDDGKYGSQLRDAGISVHSLGFSRRGVTVSGLMRLWRLLRLIRPNIVQTWMYHADLIGGVVARLAGWGIRHSYLDRAESKRTYLIAKMCAALSRLLPAHIISCSRKGAEAHVLLGYCAEKMSVVPNGYDITRFVHDYVAKQELRASLGFSAGELAIGFVARWDPLKDHQNLLAALSILRRSSKQKWHCILVGEGMDWSNTDLVDVIKCLDLSDKISLLGRRSDVPRIMNLLDAHVLSSKSEGFPNVVAEAMACGTPCVVTDVGDARDIVGETGWVVPAEDASELAKAIGFALDEMRTPDWPLRQAASRRRVVETFSMTRMVSSYKSIWFSVAKISSNCPVNPSSK
jgi:glycosyltransferase involved in cell wall biosynthesis